ncbi:acyltransferase [Burkholderia dolosa]|uniref:acyltransferase family protein n=1 Tax=Burkholderia dolosa TaxID=152500 RepID=UPI001BA1A349|nr:acyltransferase [Burkholderia dolosa]MBR8303683.1 acyltransferase [Burkholderia dolosa]
MNATNRLGGLQSLRGIAAFAVLFQHVTFYVCTAKGIDYAPYLRIDFGRFGVQLFFVLSGFVMAGCMAQGRRFLWNRVLRIYPAYWLSLIASAVLLAAPVFDWRFDWQSALLIPSTELNNSYRVPYWTLVYEITFYVVTYGIVLAGGKRVATTVCLVWLAAIAVTFKYVPISYFSPGALILFSKWNVYFIVGMLTALNIDALRRLNSTALGVFSIAGWSIGESLANVAPLGSDFAIAGAFATLVVLAIGARAVRPLERFGDYSFGVYLLHVPVIVLFMDVLGPAASTFRLGFLWAATMLVAIAGSTAFGWFEHRIHGALKRMLAAPRRYAVTVTAQSEESSQPHSRPAS